MKINLKHTILALAAFAMVGGVTAAIGLWVGPTVDAPIEAMAKTESIVYSASGTGSTGTLKNGSSSWTVTSPGSVETASPTRGLAWSKTAVTLRFTPSFDVTGLTLVGSSNQAGQNISYTVGGGESVAVGSMPKQNNKEYVFNDFSCDAGDEIVISITQGEKSTWVKSITLFYDDGTEDPIPTSIDLVAYDSITEGVKGSVTTEILYDVNYESAVGNKAVSFESSDESVAVIQNVDTSEQVATIRFLDNCPTGVTITCTSEELGSVSATHTFIVTGLVDPTYIAFEKVTEEPADWTGSYLFVCEDELFAFDGSLSADQPANTFGVEITDGVISLVDRSGTFTIDEVTDGLSIRAASGKYIGNTSDTNALAYNVSALTNTISFETDGSVTVKSSGGAYLRYNATAGQDRFRYFKSTTYTAQKAISLYRAGTDDEIVVRNFVDNNMKFDIVPDISDKGTGLCKTEGWYDSAVTEYNKLSEDQKELFVTSPWFTDAFNRLSSWAAANGDKFNASGEIVKAANNIIVGENGENAIMLSATLLLTVGVAVTGGMILLSKKRKRA